LKQKNLLLNESKALSTTGCKGWFPSPAVRQ
jgi:hypothetical protein